MKPIVQIFILSLLVVSPIMTWAATYTPTTDSSGNSNQCLNYLEQKFVFKVVQGREAIYDDLPGFFQYKDFEYKFNFEASLTNGQLSIDTDLVFPKKGIRSAWSGQVLYEMMMKTFGIDNVETIEGVWVSGTNFDQYHENLKTMGPEDAALNTWSGKMAQRYGFIKARVFSAEDTDNYGLLEEGENAVVVVFTRN